MYESILNNLGIDLGIVLIILIILMIIFIILIIWLMIKNNRLNNKLNSFMSGRDGASLEKNIYALYEDNKMLKEHMIKHRKDIHNLYKKHESR